MLHSADSNNNNSKERKSNTDKNYDPCEECRKNNIDINDNLPCDNGYVCEYM